MLSLLSLCLAIAPADWPGFRGPGGAGIARDATPPATWSATENILWKTPLPGPGSSSPVVVGDKLFLTCYTGYGEDAAKPGNEKDLKRHLLCLNCSDGRIKWQGTEPSIAAEDRYQGYISEHGYASSTPAADGDAVFVFFGKSGVVAYDMEGKKLWQTSVGTESDIRGWGTAASPVLYKDLAIVNASSECRSVIALNKRTGKQEWKAEGGKLSLSFGTPGLVKVDETRTDLVVAMPGEIWGLKPETGKMQWHLPMKPDGNISPSVLAGEKVAYITGGYQTKGTLAFDWKGGKAPETAWTSKLSSYVPTPLLHEGKLYCVNDEGYALCIDAKTGETVYQERIAVQGGKRGGKAFYASPVLANGRIYSVSRRSGTYVLAAKPAFEQVAVNKPLDDSDFNATPAVVGKRIYLRSNKFLYCLQAP